MKLKNAILLIIITTILASCSTPFGHIGKCPDAEISWIDVLKINDLKYKHWSDSVEEESNLVVEKGKKLGEVSFKMAGKACSDHKLKNGDATFLEIGTPIYEVKGYPASFMVFAEDRVFIVDQNKKAKSAKDLYPLKDYVKNIYLLSNEDDSRLHTFSSASTSQFIKEWGNLKVKRNVDYKDDPIFLEIELKNGVLFKLLYSEENNVFPVGVKGNKKIKEIIEKELRENM
ncbi:hypothetical protein CW357_14605 [Rummeliibacillus sp. TYF005]|uniref:hypothetical protein n=1 Tax=Rummeliibacillus sp. TYF005 TaxID=2058214 RepID=UPI000F52C266|nr:hypothetical protein [Rummeliibacillus sp. TYF005]RPJ94612.1 hypothetical protein CW357_14605 [Rummeliibacillus sp. TYF005]